MDKLTSRAFEKMQKREHLLRSMREQMALGRMKREVFRSKSLEVIERYQLTDDEQRAYDRHAEMTRQRKQS
ncbi:hypothetical protein [Paenibacillus daejeonensis]|uniref:hypothetical protein n=1 Tax=Paenibacillus daejeonensis TaxID=135193 RepID=UPI00035C90B4|nr:hypothetical protein [Paenibacillus daejeonensis]